MLFHLNNRLRFGEASELRHILVKMTAEYVLRNYHKVIISCTGNR